MVLAGDNTKEKANSVDGITDHHPAVLLGDRIKRVKYSYTYFTYSTKKHTIHLLNCLSFTKLRLANVTVSSFAHP